MTLNIFYLISLILFIVNLSKMNFNLRFYGILTILYTMVFGLFTTMSFIGMIIISLFVWNLEIIKLCYSTFKLALNNKFSNKNEKIIKNITSKIEWCESKYHYVDTLYTDLFTNLYQYKDSDLVIDYLYLYNLIFDLTIVTCKNIVIIIKIFSNLYPIKIINYKIYSYISLYDEYVEIEKINIQSQPPLGNFTPNNVFGKDNLKMLNDMVNIMNDMNSTIPTMNDMNLTMPMMNENFMNMMVNDNMFKNLQLPNIDLKKKKNKVKHKNNR